MKNATLIINLLTLGIMTYTYWLSRQRAQKKKARSHID